MQNWRIQNRLRLLHSIYLLPRTLYLPPPTTPTPTITLSIIHSLACLSTTFDLSFSVLNSKLVVELLNAGLFTNHFGRYIYTYLPEESRWIVSARVWSIGICLEEGGQLMFNKVDTSEEDLL